MPKPILCLDFDGVCHSYITPYTLDAVIPDPPVDGLFDFLERVTPHFRVAIYSSRSHTAEGRGAMVAWFRKWGPNGRFERLYLEFPSTKPMARVSIDDRGITFNGTWPSVQELVEFTPWNRK